MNTIFWKRTLERRAEYEQARAIAAKVGNQELHTLPTTPLDMQELREALRNKRIREQALAPYAEQDKGA